MDEIFLVSKLLILIIVVFLFLPKQVSAQLILSHVDFEQNKSSSVLQNPSFCNEIQRNKFVWTNYE